MSEERNENSFSEVKLIHTQNLRCPEGKADSEIFQSPTSPYFCILAPSLSLSLSPEFFKSQLCFASQPINFSSFNSPSPPLINFPSIYFVQLSLSTSNFSSQNSFSLLLKLFQVLIFSRYVLAFQILNAKGK